MSECDKFDAGSRKWQICTGQADLPERTINAYRERWGLQPLAFMPNIARKPVIRMATGVVKPAMSERAQQTCRCSGEQGPGTELTKLLKIAGAPDCQLCRQLATKMNQWGADECEQRITEIVNDMLPRAKAWIGKQRPWAHAALKLAPGAVADFIISASLCNLVMESINAFRRLDNAAGGSTV